MSFQQSVLLRIWYEEKKRERERERRRERGETRVGRRGEERKGEREKGEKGQEIMVFYANSMSANHCHANANGMDQGGITTSNKDG